MIALGVARSAVMVVLVGLCLGGAARADDSVPPIKLTPVKSAPTLTTQAGLKALRDLKDAQHHKCGKCKGDGKLTQKKILYYKRDGTLKYPVTKDIEVPCPEKGCVNGIASATPATQQGLAESFARSLGNLEKLTEKNEEAQKQLIKDWVDILNDDAGSKRAILDGAAKRFDTKFLKKDFPVVGTGSGTREEVDGKIRWIIPVNDNTTLVVYPDADLPTTEDTDIYFTGTVTDVLEKGPKRYVFAQGGSVLSKTGNSK